MVKSRMGNFQKMGAIQDLLFQMFVSQQLLDISL